MASFIMQNLSELQDRHYIRMARSHNYWVDFAANKLRSYEQRYGNNFCLVINRSDDSEDAYIIPAGIIRKIFREDNLDPDGQGWSARIEHGIMQHQHESISVSGYYNAVQQLISEYAINNEDITFEAVIKGESSDITPARLASLIRIFNEHYSSASPIRRLEISDRISRPGLITDYLKRFHNYTCQLCREVGFIQRSGVRYVEAHHIIEIHELLPGSFCSDNIVIVCANCHRKLHLSNVNFERIRDKRITVVINGDRYEFERNILS